MVLQNRKMNMNFKQCNRKQINRIMLFFVFTVLLGMKKDLFDAISSFGIKGIPCRDIITLDHWSANSFETCDYLTLRSDSCMLYNHINSELVD